MAWMFLVGFAFIAGIVLIADDDDDTAVDTSGGSDSGGGSDGGDGGSVEDFVGNANDNEITGDDGDNTILGKNGNDLLDGGEGVDRIFGDGGNDTVDGGPGNDSVFGGNGSDLVIGGEGDDLLHGNRDGDFLIDTSGTDSLFGDKGDDLIVSSGNLLPDTENDALAVLTQQMDFTTDADTEGDSVNGGAGNDFIIFGVDDTVTGGSGEDTFFAPSWLEPGEAATVTDFDPEEDRLIYSYHETQDEPEMTMRLVENEDGTSDVIVSANGSDVLRVQDQDESFDLSEHLIVVMGAAPEAA